MNRQGYLTFPGLLFLIHVYGLPRGVFSRTSNGRCPVPALTHGHFEYTDRMYVEEGRMVPNTWLIIPSCDDGYTSDQPDGPICRAGQWDKQAHCIAKCGTPGQPPSNGFYNATSGTYGDVVTLTCDHGYVLKGQGQRTCGADGIWSYLIGSCHGIVYCQSLQMSPSNGRYNGTSGIHVYGDVARLICNLGYDLQGQRQKTCGADGRWSSLSGSCKAKQCGTPGQPPSNGFYNATSGSYGDVARLICSPGYDLQGHGQKTCGADGRWSSLSGSCKANCGTPGQPPSNGYYSATSGIYGDVARLICNHGYELHGQGQRTCGTDGRWSSLSGRCQVFQCVPLVNPSHGQFNQRSGWFQTQSTLICDKGYQTQTPVTRTCQDNGTWSLPVGTCQAKACERLRSSIHGNYTNGLETLSYYKDVTQFTCELGYVIIVNETQVDFYNRTCQSDKTWSGSEAECRGACFSLGKDSETYPWTVLLVGVEIGVALTLLSVLIIFASVAYTRRRRKKKSSANELYTIPTATREDTSYYDELGRPDSFNGGNSMEEAHQYEITDP